jgi:Tfp pilus assembly protein PilN
MAQSINLIPQQEVQEQQKVKIVKASTIFTIIALVLVAIASAFYFYQATNYRLKISNHDKSIARLRADIQDLSDIEITARNLDTRYQALANIYNERVHFSKFLDELKQRIPDTIEIESLNIAADNKVNITGMAENYLSIADFIRQLTEAEGFIAGVTLNSVTLESSKDKISFFIIVEYESSYLK